MTVGWGENRNKQLSGLAATTESNPTAPGHGEPSLCLSLRAAPGPHRDRGATRRDRWQQEEGDMRWHCRCLLSVSCGEKINAGTASPRAEPCFHNLCFLISC